MKKTLKPILSVLLAFAMILPMCGIARAEASVTLSASRSSGATNTLYSHSGHGDTLTVTATATDSDGYDKIKWTFASLPSGVTANQTSDTYVSFANPSATLVLTAAAGATSSGSFSISATLHKSSDNDSTTNDKTANITISVAADTVSSVSYVLPTTTVAVGGTITPTTRSATYVSGYTNTAATVSCTDTNGNVTVNTNGVITGAVAGNTSITPTLDGFTATASSITVTAPAANISANATLGSTATAMTLYNASMISLYSQIYTAFQTAYGAPPSAGATLSLTSANSTYGSFNFTNGSLFTAFASAVFTPVTAGSYTAAYTLTDATNANKQITGTLTISVSTGTSSANITLANTLTPYLFSGYDSTGITTGQSQLQTAAGNAAYQLQFGAVATNSATAAPGQSVGVLYTNSTMATQISNQLIPYTSLGSLYFVPTGYAGTYSITYGVYSGVTKIKDGTLTIRVTSGTLNVSFNLNSGNAYTFSSKSDTSSGLGTGDTAYNLITSAIYTYGGLTAQNYLIRFATPSTTVGTLYYNSTSAGSAVSSTSYLTYSQLASLCFQPSQPGTFQTAYYVYSTTDTTNALASGTLTINVSNILGNADFSYKTTYNGTVTLNESDFLALVQKTNSAYGLAYVTFSRYSGSGTFKNGASTIIPGVNSPTLYSRTYAGAPTNASYLSNVTFTAPASGAGYTAVSFSAYPTLAGSTVGSPVSGVFYIYYTAANVPAIVYNAYGLSSVTLRESDFLNAYKTAMGSAAVTNPNLTVRFDTIPGYGRLYQTPTGSTKTQLSVNVSSYSFTVGSTNTSRSVGIVTYEPLSTRIDATDEISYVVYSSANSALFTGTVQFKLSAPKAVNVTSEGVTFSSSDFYSVTDSDPVIYVQFKAPASGKLYVADGSRLLPVTESTGIYTVDVSHSPYLMKNLHYVPKAGQTDTVTLTYTEITKGGRTYTNTMTVSPTSKNSTTKASTVFSDVTASNVGSWAADSVDFAKKFGFVKGVGNGQFSPNATMKRCDLVLILYRMAGSPAAGGTAPYTDLPTATASSYAQEIYNSALWAYRNNIMDGVVTDNKYNPNGAITRQDYAKILYNYTKAMGVSVANNGSALYATAVDKDKVASYAVDAMTWALANGYINGMETSRLMLSPDTAATRAQIVTLLHRYLTF